MSTELLASVAYARKVVAVERKLAHMLGSPDALRAAADTLSSDVNSASEDLAAVTAPNSLKAMENDDAWNSIASQLYFKSFLDQNDHVARIAETVKVLEDTVRKLADAIEQFYIEVAIAVASLVAGIMEIVILAVELASVAAAIASPAELVKACIAFTITIASGAAIFFTLSLEVRDSIAALQTKLTAWPSAQFVK